MIYTINTYPLGWHRLSSSVLLSPSAPVGDRSRLRKLWGSVCDKGRDDGAPSCGAGWWEEGWLPILFCLSLHTTIRKLGYILVAHSRLLHCCCCLSYAVYCSYFEQLRTKREAMHAVFVYCCSWSCSSWMIRSAPRWSRDAGLRASSRDSSVSFRLGRQHHSQTTDHRCDTSALLVRFETASSLSRVVERKMNHHGQKAQPRIISRI
jgi:hypothetical protein